MKKLKQIRKNMGLNMEDFGELLGVCESTISLYERGERGPTHKKLLEIINILGVEPNDIIDYEDKDNG